MAFIVYLLLLAALFIFLIFWNIIALPYLKLKFYNFRFRRETQLLYVPLGGFQRHLIDDYQFHRDSSYSIKQLVMEQPHTKILLTNIYDKPAILVIDPNLQNDVWKKPHLYRKLKEDFILHDILDGGLFNVDYDQWKKQRQMVGHKFKFKSVQKYIPLIDIAAERFIQKHIKQTKGKIPFHTITECRKITSHIILETFFGPEFQNKRINNKPMSQEISDLMQDTMTLNSQSVYMQIKRLALGEKYQFHPYFRCEQEISLQKRLKELRNVIKNIINDRIKEKSTSKRPIDLLDTYIQQYKQNHCDIDEIVSQSINFFFAGQEPLATTLALTLYFMAKNKNIQNRLRLDLKKMEKSFTKNQQMQEDQSKFEKDLVDFYTERQKEQNISLHLLNLDYLQAILNETLRIQGPMTMITHRVATKDHLIGNKYPVKKGWIVNTFIQAANRNPKFYHNPDEFMPERWLGDEYNNIDQNIFCPFSAGPRNCLGQLFAQIQAKIIILKMIQNFELIENEECQLVMNQKGLYSPIKEDLIKIQKIEKLEKAKF